MLVFTKATVLPSPWPYPCWGICLFFILSYHIVMDFSLLLCFVCLKCSLSFFKFPASLVGSFFRRFLGVGVSTIFLGFEPWELLWCWFFSILLESTFLVCSFPWSFLSMLYHVCLFGCMSVCVCIFQFFLN